MLVLFYFSLLSVKEVRSYILAFVLTFPASILDMIRVKSERQVFRVLPRLNSVFALLYSIFTLLIVPMFYINTYLFGGYHSLDISIVSCTMSLFICFLSCSQIYLIFMVWWNIFSKNKSNIFYKCIYALYQLYLNNKNKQGFYKYLFLLILVLILFLLINMAALTFILSCIGISKSSSFISYIYIRISLLPFFVYMYNLVISNVINSYRKEKTLIDYSLFSQKMVESLTLTSLLWMVAFIVTSKYIFYIFYSNNQNDFLTKQKLKSIDRNNLRFITPDYLRKIYSTGYKLGYLEPLLKTLSVYASKTGNQNKGILSSIYVKYIRDILSSFVDAIIGKSIFKAIMAKNVYPKNLVYPQSAFQKSYLPKVIGGSLSFPLYIDTSTISSVKTPTPGESISSKCHVLVWVIKGPYKFSAGYPLTASNKAATSDSSLIIAPIREGNSKKLPLYKGHVKVSLKLSMPIAKYEVYPSKANKLDEFVAQQVKLHSNPQIYSANVPASPDLTQGLGIEVLKDDRIIWGRSNTSDYGDSVRGSVNTRNRDSESPGLSIHNHENLNPDEGILDLGSDLSNDSELSDVGSSISVSSSFIATLPLYNEGIAMHLDEPKCGDILDKGKGIDMGPDKPDIRDNIDSSSELSDVDSKKTSKVKSCNKAQECYVIDNADPSKEPHKYPSLRKAVKDIPGLAYHMAAKQLQKHKGVIYETSEIFVKDSQGKRVESSHDGVVLPYNAKPCYVIDNADPSKEPQKYPSLMKAVKDIDGLNYAMASMRMNSVGVVVYGTSRIFFS